MHAIQFESSASLAAAGPLGSVLAMTLLDSIECGLVVCEQNADIRYANRAASREIGPGRTLQRDGRRVVAGDRWADLLACAIREAAVRGKHSMLAIGHGPDRLMLAAVPLRHNDGADVAGALLILGRRSICSSLGMELLAGRFGLTHAERRVLLGLADARSAGSIAAITGVQLSTVRTQIQSIRTKLDVRSIDELLLQMAQVPPVAAAVA